MKRLFFSQSMLDSMVDAGKITVDKGVLTMLAGDNPTFRLLPAYRFVKTIDNSPDAAGLAGQIHSEREIRDMGAEILMDSIIYKDVAYQADPGFIAERITPGESAPPEKRPVEPPAQTSEPAADKAQNADDLSKFILDNLR
jgi:hypothetical protein